VLSMVLKECVCSKRCWANLDVWLLFLKASLCSLYCARKFIPVWPTYAILQSGHVSLYTLDCVYLSVLWCVCVSWLYTVLFVQNTIFMFVCLNKLVMYVISFPV
jgi:hypothetical protein